jgi:sulfur-oxidizing protein SoxY
MTTLRRQLLATGALLSIGVRPSIVLATTLEEAVRSWAGKETPRTGRVRLEIAPLIDNGNTVPITIQVESPMTSADYVREIAVFNERNPQRDVVRFSLSPASGRAKVSTRIRLATSQQLVALARMSDGSVWQHSVDVIVTLAACIES